MKIIKLSKDDPEMLTETQVVWFFEHELYQRSTEGYFGITKKSDIRAIFMKARSSSLAITHIACSSGVPLAR